jgi:hypothetical protein
MINNDKNVFVPWLGFRQWPYIIQSSPIKQFTNRDFFISSSSKLMLPMFLTIWHCQHILTIVFTPSIQLCQKYLWQISTKVLYFPKCPKSSCIWITSAILSYGLGTNNPLK